MQDACNLQMKFWHFIILFMLPIMHAHFLTKLDGPKLQYYVL